MSSGAVQFYASNKGWGAHLGDCTVKGARSIPESKLHIDVLVLKVVLLTHNHHSQHTLSSKAGHLDGMDVL